MSLLLVVLGLLSLAFLAGVLIYVCVSFMHLQAHAPARPPGATLRAVAREIGWALLVQPLLPLCYVVGRRMGGVAGRRPIVLVHGYMQNRVDFLALARALARGGAGPLFGFNYAWWQDVDRSAARLGRFVESVRAETRCADVDLVCHSLGGLVAMSYLTHGGGPRVRRLVTIASPHGGVAWRGPIPGQSAPHLRADDELGLRALRRVPVPTLSIFSTHDNVVHPAATSSIVARGGTDLVVEAPGHLTILFSREVHAAVRDFLLGDAK